MKTVACDASKAGVGGCDKVTSSLDLNDDQ